MKLWVDDIRNAPDETWTVARSVDSAINCIDMFGREITEISLDHDISHQVVIGTVSRPYPCNETFTPVARYMVHIYGTGSGSSFPMPTVTIHSSNEVGARKMQSILDRGHIKSEYRPFGAANRLEMEV